MLASSQANSSGSPMSPYLTTSENPEASSRVGKVLRVCVSTRTRCGWWKAPIMFLPKAWFTPVLPPTEESTVAMTVVGIWAAGMPCQLGHSSIAVLPARSGITRTKPYLYEVDPSLVRSCRIAGHVSDDTATQGYEGGLPVQPELQCPCPDLADNIQVLVLLAVWQDQCFSPHAWGCSLQAVQ